MSINLDDYTQEASSLALRGEFRASGLLMQAAAAIGIALKEVEALKGQGVAPLAETPESAEA